MAVMQIGFVQVIDPMMCQECCYSHRKGTPCPPPPIVTTNGEPGLGNVSWVTYTPMGPVPQESNCTETAGHLRTPRGGK